MLFIRHVVSLPCISHVQDRLGRILLTCAPLCVQTRPAIWATTTRPGSLLTTGKCSAMCKYVDSVDNVECR